MGKREQQAPEGRPWGPRTKLGVSPVRPHLLPAIPLPELLGLDQATERIFVRWLPL